MHKMTSQWNDVVLRIVQLMIHLEFLLAPCRAAETPLSTFQVARGVSAASDREPEPSVMVACMNNDYELLGQKLKPPRNPNFKNANRVTPLYVAASKGNLN